MGGNGGDDDQHRRENFIITDADELEGVQEGHHPGHQNQPGPVAAPLFCLGAVEDAAVDPGEAGIYNGENGVDEGGNGRAEACQVRQEGHKIEGFNIAHQAEARVTHTEQVFQGFAQAFWFLVLLRCFFHGRLPPNSFSVFPEIRRALAHSRGTNFANGWIERRMFCTFCLYLSYIFQIDLSIET